VDGHGREGWRVESGEWTDLLECSNKVGALDSNGASARLEGLANLNVYMISIAVILLHFCFGFACLGRDYP